MPLINDKDPRVLALWFIPKRAPLKPINTVEANWAAQLTPKRSLQFQHSRGYVREALSEIWKIPSLSIPLIAPPGKPPALAYGWGHVSFSHCCDGLLIGWSPTKIGVDLERVDRSFKGENLKNRYFSMAEKKDLDSIPSKNLNAKVLQLWVIKESAIKWQKGSIALDFSKWIFDPDSQMAIHQTLGYKIGIYQIHFQNWYIAIAYNNNLHKNKPILCSLEI